MAFITQHDSNEITALASHSHPSSILSLSPPRSTYCNKSSAFGWILFGFDATRPNTTEHVPEKSIPMADLNEPLRSPIIASSFCFSHHSDRPVKLPPTPSGLSIHTCCFARDNHEIPQAMSSAFPWNHCSSLILKIFDCPSIGTPLPYNLPPKICVSPDYQVLKLFAQRNSSWQHSSAHGPVPASAHFCQTFLMKNLVNRTSWRITILIRKSNFCICNITNTHKDYRTQHITSGRPFGKK